MAGDTDGWRPLLSGQAADRALATIEKIASELRSVLSHRDVAGSAGFSLLDGDTGIALFFAYLHLAFGRKEDKDLALAALGHAIDGIGETVVPPGLYTGFSGVAWAVEHLRDRILDPLLGDPGKEIAESVSAELQGARWERSFDLLHGLVGLGVYGLERLPRSGGEACVEAVIIRLAETAEQSPAGIAWWTRPEWLPEPTRRDFPAGYYNLGIAHGQPGVIGFLSAAYAAGVARAKTLDLARLAVSWLLGHKLPPGNGSAFPRSIDPLHAPQPSRLSWCYGDLGIAVTLLASARQTGHQEWEREALVAARCAAARTTELGATKDACLCHGTAGIAHLFNRLFQATGDPDLSDAARFWVDRTFETEHPGKGIANFLSWSVDDQGEPGWKADPGFLNGAAGIGLALLAAVSSAEPAWDRAMLLSVPPISDSRKLEGDPTPGHAFQRGEGIWIP
ncbi:MAG TPA: lanthionine synthetase C family protein [Thermoanaerobaculia bacterium]|jgi:lantibiotic modifying enzyme|nr:lanthionine synthetase C family protein [Thermoanaerobaculia bacterium]